MCVLFGDDVGRLMIRLCRSSAAGLPGRSLRFVAARCVCPGRSKFTELPGFMNDYANNNDINIDVDISNSIDVNVHLKIDANMNTNIYANTKINMNADVHADIDAKI